MIPKAQPNPNDQPTNYPRRRNTFLLDEAQQLVLLLDGDQAGLAAVERLAGPLLAAGAAARVALLPQGDDPDTFARREEAEGVERLRRLLLRRRRPRSSSTITPPRPMRP